MKNRIPWFYPVFDNREILETRKVILSNYLNEGKIVEKFENAICQLLGVNYCVACTSGTSALTLSLLALDIQKDDEVIVPNFTFIATANAASLIGAKVRFADVKKENFTINPEDLKNKITKKTKCIITVDVNGRACDYKEILKICKENKIKLVTDSAEAFYSQYGNKKLGTLGDLGCFSLSAMKTISTGQGGFVTTNSYKLYKELRKKKDQGRNKKGTGGNDIHFCRGHNFKYTNLQAAIGLAQLTKLKRRIKNFHVRDNIYQKLLSKNNKIFLPEKKNGEILQWFDLVSRDSKKIKSRLENKKIEYRSFWFPINSQKPYYDLDKKGFKNSYFVSKNGIWLPSFFGISEKTINFICKEILSVLD